MNLEFRELERRVDRVEAAIERIDQTLASMDQKLESLNKRVDSLHQRIDRIFYVALVGAIGIIGAIIGQGYLPGQ